MKPNDGFGFNDSEKQITPDFGKSDHAKRE
jgi:hypothetical protein